MNYQSGNQQNEIHPFRRRGPGAQVFIGIVVALIGLGILLRRMDYPIPHWLFGWEMILIIVGIFIGIKSKFSDINWIIPIVIGSIFLADDVFHYSLKPYAWPVGIIVIGAIIALKPNRLRRRWMHDDNPPSATSGYTPPPTGVSAFSAEETFSNDPADVLDVTAVFGGAKRNIVSKNFSGGSIVAVFGGAEINLMHADINGEVRLEAVNVLGGTKLIVPPTWDVRSEMVAIFGGVDDKRAIRPEMIDPKKRLIIEGTSFMGGLDIRSY